MKKIFNDRVKIGAREFKISLANEKNDDILNSNPQVASYIDHSASKIVVREDELSQDSYEELVIHEIMHAIIKNSGIDQCLKEGFTEEFLVSALAPRIHDLIKRNL